ncbi:MAG TPA: RibD family protein, partial [Candidatus Humimicrobiaceae bacterium]
IASSIDGKTALKNKKSKWITSAPARETVQKIRYRYDCILTGINTVIEDDPLLYPRCAQYNRNIDRTFRDFFQNLNRDLEPGSDISSTSRNSSNSGYLDTSDNLGSLDNASNDAAVKTPLLAKKFFRVILDSGLRIGRDSNIVKTSHAIRTIIFTRAGKTFDTEKAGYLNKAGIDILKAGGRDFLTGTDGMGNTSEKRTYLDLKEVLEILYTRYEITSVLVESGPALMTEFIRQNLADKFYFFIAPKIIGGDSPFNMFAGLGISVIDDAFKLEFDKITKAGSDIFITAYPSRTGSAIV